RGWWTWPAEPTPRAAVQGSRQSAEPRGTRRPVVVARGAVLRISPEESIPVRAHRPASHRGPGQATPPAGGGGRGPDPPRGGADQAEPRRAAAGGAGGVRGSPGGFWSREAGRGGRTVIVAGQTSPGDSAARG